VSTPEASAKPRATADISGSVHCAAALAVGRAELKCAVRPLVVVVLDVLVEHWLGVGADRE